MLLFWAKNGGYVSAVNRIYVKNDIGMNILIAF